MKHLIILIALLSTCIIGCSSTQGVSSSSKGKSEVEQKNETVILETSLGNITILLDGKHAPLHTANFVKLAKQGFYDGTTFHRVIPGFMIQGGDPNSRDEDRSTHGIGGPNYKIDAEIGLKHGRGVIAAARQGDQVNPKRQSSGSQFYITVVPTPHLDGQYSVFGKVTDGMDVVDAIAAVKRDARDNPIEPVIIKHVTVQ
ncbi:MAG TPA: peptidylprolyl isomerase [Bacteroidota bacterium]|nr:peptidylprolyl isomerase [Bacteroidota bacterium]